MKNTQFSANFWVLLNVELFVHTFIKLAVVKKPRFAIVIFLWIS